MFRINSSLPVLMLNSLNQVNRLTARSLERLSTGLRINRAADNPAGLVVSEGLGALIASLEQANQNAQNASNLASTAESALGEIEDIIVRLKELAIEAADTSISDSERSAIQDEAAGLLEEIDRIANTTEFNDIQLLSTTQNFTFFVGTGVAGVDETISLQLPASQASEYIAGVTSSSIATSANSAALTSLDLGITSVNIQRGRIGAVQSRLEFTLSDIGAKTVALETAQSAIRDADFAEETVNLLRAQILTQTNVFALAQVNQLTSSVLPLLDFALRAS